MSMAEGGGRTLVVGADWSTESQRGIEWARALAEGGPNALAMTKGLLHRFSHQDLSVAEAAQAISYMLDVRVDLMSQHLDALVIGKDRVLAFIDGDEDDEESTHAGL